MAFFLLIMQDRRQGFSFLDKLHGNRIHTMPGVLRGEALAFKDVAQMAFAVGADDFNPAPIRIRVLVNRPGDLIIEAGPSATGFKLIRGLVQRLVALPADVGARHFIVFILSRKRALSAFVQEDVLFFFGK